MSNNGDVLVKTNKSVVVTERQIKMAQMISDDVPRKEIAKKLKLSVRTVEAHIDSMRRCLGCQNTAAMIAILFRKNLVK